MIRRTSVVLPLIALAISVAILSAPAFGQWGYPPNDQGGYPPSNRPGYSTSNQAGDPPSRVARLSYITGKVSFEPSGEDRWNQASMNYPMTTGDRLYTDDDGRAELETGNIAIRMAPDTDLSTTTLSDQLTQLGLAQGTLRVRAYQIYPGNSVEIDTPSAALTLLRAGSYRVETYPDGNTTLVAVTEGDLEISGAGINRTLHAGQAIKLEGTDDVRMDWISLPDRDDFDQWCGDRDRRFLNSDSRQYVSPYTPGYSDLDDYGRWDNAPEYGRVWYPSQVPVNWAPYRYGRWVWVEPWGWTWVEEEPWGFAPFHYGRWVLIGSRWGWLPGPVVRVRPVYAPALVAFVGGPRAGVQVWFPLGPRDPYLPWYHHSDEYRRQVNITNVRITNINVTNIRVENIHYTYQRIAPTACNTETFRSSRWVGRERVRVDANAIGRARVIPHPEIQPDERAIHAGFPEAHPPVERIRPRIENRVVYARPAGPEGGRGWENGNDRDGRPDRERNDGRQGPDRTPFVVNHRGEAGTPGGVSQDRQNQDRQNQDRQGDGSQATDRTPFVVNHRGEAGTPGGVSQGRQSEDPRNDDRRNEDRRNDDRRGEDRRGEDRNGERNRGGADAGRYPQQANRGLPGRDNPPPAGDDRDIHGRNAVAGPYQPKPAIVPQNEPYRPQPAIVQQNNGPYKPQPAVVQQSEPYRPQPAVVQQSEPYRPQPAVVQQSEPYRPQPALVQQNGRGPDNGPPQDRRTLVSRNPAPPQNPPFSERQPAMQEHPGRPLEPQQVDNIRHGSPAGPRQDREVPAHIQPAPKQTPPQARNDSKQDHEHDHDRR